MCGRYFFTLDEAHVKVRAMLAELARRALPMSDQVRFGEIFPSPIVPVILVEEGIGYTVRPMKWGFPRTTGSGLVINSRSEKADATPMFQRAARERRCLIPANGFFEWRRVDRLKTKDKFSFSLMDDGELMYMAGLYGQFDGGFAAGGYDGFAILTRDADEQVSPYHNRMPVILRDPEIIKAWLSPGIPYDTLRAVFETPQLNAQPVEPDAGTPD